MLFSFKKPLAFSYEAGQTMDVTLLNPPETDADGKSRSFSIASAPHEEELMVAMRMRDTAFKRVLKNMPLGTEVELEGPFGSLTLSGVERPVVLLAGGIGVSLARSIVADAVRRRHREPLMLLYSNPHEGSAAFLEELYALSRRLSLFTFIPTMTRAESDWRGETGRIDAAKLAAYANLGAKPIFYLSGMPMMLSDLRAQLLSLGIPDTDIRMESFAGY